MVDGIIIVIMNLSYVRIFKLLIDLNLRTNSLQLFTQTYRTKIDCLRFIFDIVSSMIPWSLPEDMH